MPYVLKSGALLNLEAGQEVEITERFFYGGETIDAGDEAFLWFSGPIQRLAWSAAVIEVDNRVNGRATIRVRLINPSAPDAITTSQLKPFRDIDDGTVLSRLSFKFYKQSHNKVAYISEEEAQFLRDFFLG